MLVQYNSSEQKLSYRSELHISRLLFEIREHKETKLNLPVDLLCSNHARRVPGALVEVELFERER
jgi:hypothetical protein